MLNASLNTTEEITLQGLATAIDSLAISMARGFESLESRMGGIENKVDDIENRMATKADLLQLEDRLTLRIVALEQK